MKLNADPFRKIEAGQKTYELRLFDGKRKQICIGDEIIFTNTDSGELCRVSVQNLLTFDSFEELYAALPLTMCGYDGDELQYASPNDMEKYYSKEEQSRFGVVAIEIKLL